MRTPKTKKRVGNYHGRPPHGRDGWSGRLFRKLREARGRSRDWVAAATGRSSQSVEDYELDNVFPSHRWRDAAALSLRIDRAELGAEGCR